MKVLFLLMAVALICSARPDPSEYLSARTDASRPNHFEGRNLRRSTSDNFQDMLTYTVDVASDAHSLDLEPSVLAVSCHPAFLDVVVAKPEVVKQWGERFVVFGSAQWGCPEGGIVRRVSKVMWEGDRLVRLWSSPAKPQDVFENAHIKFARSVTLLDIDNPYTINSSVSWNMASDGTASKSEIVLNKLTCDVGCESSSASSLSLCSLCPSGVELKSVVYCDDCYARVGVDSVTFELKITTDSASFNFYGSASAELEIGQIGLNLTAVGSYSNEFVLLKAPIWSAAPSFTVLGLTFELGAYAKLSAVLNITDASAAAHIGVSYSKKVAFVIEASTGDSTASVTTTVKDGNYGSDVSALASGDAAASVGLRAGLVLSAGSLATVQGWIQPTLDTNIDFSYPAFDALDSELLVNNTLAHYGACNRIHLLEYLANFRIPYGASVTVATASFSTTGEAISTIPLISGCLFNLSTNDPLKHYTLVFMENLDKLLNQSVAALNVAVATEIAKALDLYKTSVVANITNNVVNFVITAANAIADAAEIESRIASQASYSDSALWSGATLKSLKSSYVSTNAKSSSSNSISSGAAAGIAVGCCAGVVAIGAAVAGIVHVARRKRSSQPAAEGVPMS